MLIHKMINCKQQDTCALNQPKYLKLKNRQKGDNDKTKAMDLEILKRIIEKRVTMVQTEGN